MKRVRIERDPPVCGIEFLSRYHCTWWAKTPEEALSPRRGCPEQQLLLSTVRLKFHLSQDGVTKVVKLLLRPHGYHTAVDFLQGKLKAKEKSRSRSAWHDNKSRVQKKKEFSCKRIEVCLGILDQKFCPGSRTHSWRPGPTLELKHPGILHLLMKSALFEKSSLGQGPEGL